jgi:hypothetical protein
MNPNERVIELLEELVAWTRFASRTALLGVWETILEDEKHLLAYELSDGSRSQKEVGDAVGLSQPAISNLWQRWRKQGIVRMVGGRVAHLARPSDMGVERAQKLNVAAKLRTPSSTAADDGGGG